MPRTSSRTTCTVDHSHLARKLSALPTSQAEPGRHRCAGCAFEMGFSAGLKEGRKEMQEKVEALMQKVKGWAKESRRE